MSKSRKHGVFAVSGDVVILTTKPYEDVCDAIAVAAVLETVFKQMQIAGNWQRMICSPLAKQILFFNLST